MWGAGEGCFRQQEEHIHRHRDMRRLGWFLKPQVTQACRKWNCCCEEDRRMVVAEAPWSDLKGFVNCRVLQSSVSCVSSTVESHSRVWGRECLKLTLLLIKSWALIILLSVILYSKTILLLLTMLLLLLLSRFSRVWLCDPIDGSPPGSPIPGILKARTLEWIDISFSNAWKWKWSPSVASDPQRPHGLQPSRLLRPWEFPGKSTGVGCHCLLGLLTTEQL